MPYSKEHKKATRQKILNSAITLFSTQGFDQVSLDDLMKHAGLTRGAFYAHFKNKKAVYARAIIAGAKQSRINQCKPVDMTLEEWTIDLLAGYLSIDHVYQHIAPCPLAFMVTDIANNEKEIRATYTRMYKLINKAILSQLKDNTAVSEEDILATTAMMIGSVAIGRALNDEAMTRRLLDSSRVASLKLLGLGESIGTKKSLIKGQT